MLDCKGIKSVRQTVVYTAAGTAPKLPETVTAEFSNGTVQPVPVIWDRIHPSDYSKAGSFSVRGVLKGTTVVPKASITVTEGAGPLLSISVISDTHVDTGLSSKNGKKLKNALLDLKEINLKAEALCVVGDMTDHGNDDEYDLFMKILDSVDHPKTYFVIGNHDIRWHDGGYKETYQRFLTKTKMPAGHYDEIIKGFHFIFLSTDQDLKDQANISDDQLNWLSAKLAEGADQNKPIFVFLHQSLANTSVGSYPGDGYGTSGYPDGVVQDSQLRSLLAKYPQVIFLTGHTHAVVDHPKCTIFTSGFWCVNTATTFSTIPSDGYGSDNGSQGLCLDIYPDKVLIKGRDFAKQEWPVNGQWTIPFPGGHAK